MVQTKSGQPTCLATVKPRRIAASDGMVVRVIKNFVSLKGAAPTYGIAIFKRNGPVQANGATSSVRRNADGLAPPSAFYRLRYPHGRITPPRSELPVSTDELAGASWEDAEWQ